MRLNNKYNFREEKIIPPFCESKIKELNYLINRSISFTLLSIPGAGATQFLRYFTVNSTYKVFFIESRSVTTFSKSNFLKVILQELEGKSKFQNDQDLLLACKIQLENLEKENKRIVLIFNKFNNLAKHLDYNLFSNLRLLRNINPEKIIMIFTANRPLHELNPKAIKGPNLNFLLHYMYFGVYREADFRKLAPIYYPLIERKTEREIKNAIEFSGGHINLLSLLLNSEASNPITDPYIVTQLKDILDTLTYSQKIVFKRIVNEKEFRVDEYLLKMNFILKNNNGKYKIFTPLLKEYLKARSSTKLPLKEAKLFKLLKRNQGKIVLKDEIFNHVWGDNSSSASDWALNALIYRLKKHQLFKNSGYIIQNIKKQGYILLKEEVY